MGRAKALVKKLQVMGNVKEFTVKRSKAKVIVTKARKAEEEAKRKEVNAKNKYNAIRKAGDDAPNLKRRATRRLQNDMKIAQGKKIKAEKANKKAEKKQAKA